MEEIRLKLYSKFEHLKSLKEMPNLRLVYLTDYFAQLKSQVDVSFLKKSQLIQRDDETKQIKLKTNWIQIIDQIEQFESECLKLNQKMKKKSICNGNLEFISAKLDELNQIDSIKQNELIEEINELIYDEMFQIEKEIFLNRSMIFLDKENCQDVAILGKIDHETTVGRLIYVKNEYFGPKSIEYLKSNDVSNNKISNEILKCKEFKNSLKKQSSNQLEETQLNLNNLIKINLSNSQLKFINSSVFKGLVNLQVINLSHNLLTTLTSDLFNGLSNLKSLYLYNNQLNNLDSNLFKNLTKLNLLMISNNNLNCLEENLFEGLVNLTEINLANNELEQIHSNIFNGLYKLNEIRLSGNKLTSIDANLFQGLTKLKEIYLDGNRLERLDAGLFTSQTNSLIFVHLARNKLTSLDEKIFKELKKISRIILTQNECLIVDKKLFKNYAIDW